MAPSTPQRHGKALQRREAQELSSLERNTQPTDAQSVRQLHLSLILANHLKVFKIYLFFLKIFYC